MEVYYMDKAKKLAPHEAFELHELLTVKNICATKSSAMANLVKDDELKSLMRNDFSASQEHIRELRDLLRMSEFADTSFTRDAGDVDTARNITH
jgi:similar to spore coat protein